mgnify:CR=1 FL=1
MLKASADTQLPIEKELVLSILCARLGIFISIPTITIDNIWRSAYEYSVKQRVVLLLYDYLKRDRLEFPDDLYHLLSKLYRSNSIHNLIYSAELLNITSLFAENMISCIHLKGVSLSEYLYQDLGLRPVVDLDILVQQADFFKANELLLQRGYTRMLQEDTIKGKIHKRMTHQWPYRHEARRVLVELHRQFVPKSRANRVESEGIWSRAQTIQLDGQSIQIMSPEDLLVYLSIHASKEFWGSLLQVNDIASLIVQHPDLDWSVVIEVARTNHSILRVLISLALASALLRIPLPQIIEDEIEKKGARGRIYFAVLRNLVGSNDNEKSVWSARFWQDLNLAESWPDRIVIVGYKGINVLAAAADRLLQPFRGVFVAKKPDLQG